ncbi:MAG: hypothetical protein M3295_02450 [Chloroflexota bacterium]|nr:hypothetical protein [Chloroflexota bacterium]
MHLAAQNAPLDAIRRLLAADADPTARDALYESTPRRLGYGGRQQRGGSTTARAHRLNRPCAHSIRGLRP